MIVRLNKADVIYSYNFGFFLSSGDLILWKIEKEEKVKEIFRSTVATLKYDDHYKMACLVWNCMGGLSFEKYKEPFEFLLQATHLPVHGILSDNRKQGIIKTEMRSWLQKTGTPRAIKRGLKYYYVVSDNNPFKQYYINTIFKLLEGDGMERKMFKDFDEAEQSIKTALAQNLLVF